MSDNRQCSRASISILLRVGVWRDCPGGTERSIAFVQPFPRYSARQRIWDENSGCRCSLRDYHCRLEYLYRRTLVGRARRDRGRYFAARALGLPGVSAHRQLRAGRRDRRRRRFRRRVLLAPANGATEFLRPSRWRSAGSAHRAWRVGGLALGLFSRRRTSGRRIFVGRRLHLFIVVLLAAPRVVRSFNAESVMIAQSPQPAANDRQHSRARCSVAPFLGSLRGDDPAFVSNDLGVDRHAGASIGCWFPALTRCRFAGHLAIGYVSC